ncbi:ATP-binding protein [Magnetospirillum aberrantis]|uniref:histidine kinase n=1 Tax=Magnetospirillum aberrantis SpK TaxID=908842 RepID=A0A7C9QRN8_9PROT|nr:two-component sensor histidine kinase [Magnetospirillum aberrantis SpK]
MRRFAIGGRMFPVAFLAVYLALDWATFIHQAPAINITPWNPPAGLYMALLLLRPRGALAPILTFVALMAGDVVVRGMPAPLPVLVVANVLVLGAYAVGSLVLVRRFAVSPALDRLSDMVWLVVVVPVAAVAASAGFTIPYAVAGFLEWSAFPSVAVQYWVGDVIAILTVTPFLLLHRRGMPHDGPRRGRLEALAQAAAVVAALALTFNPLVPDPSKILYVLFPPIIWVAMRRGVAAATVAVLVTQVGVVLGLLAVSGHWRDLTYYQAVMVALAATGLLVGAVVSERWRLEARLSERQAELARVARLSLIGEMASSLAHELNQPLFTTIGYTRSSLQLLLRGGERDAVVDLMERAAREAERAAQVLSRIRGFLRQDGMPAAVNLAGAVADMLALARPDANRHGIAVVADLPQDLPRVWMDRVQLDQVLLNLLRNSVDALAARPGNGGAGGEIRLSARPVDGKVEVSVADNGPGVPEDKVGPLFDLFFTTKPSGMGLGLPICRSIVEAHGGRLWLAANTSGGACFSFTVPAVENV